MDQMKLAAVSWSFNFSSNNTGLSDFIIIYDDFYIKIIVYNSYNYI